MTGDIKIRRRKLSEYRSDPNNPNKGSERGRRLLRESLTEVGPARSIVAAADDVLLAGNQTAQAALETGIEDVIEIEAPPNALVVVKRPDLASDDPKARKLVHHDNRDGDFREYDVSILELDADAGLLDGLFRADELADLRLELDAEMTVNAVVDAAEHEPDKRLLGRDPARLIKAIIYCENVAVFERALKATGLVNRGDALLKVCEFYLEQGGGETD